MSKIAKSTDNSARKVERKFSKNQKESQIKQLSASVSRAIKVDPSGFKFTSKKYSQLSLFIFVTNKNKNDLATHARS